MIYCYTNIYFHTRFYYYNEQINVGLKVKVVFNIGNSFVVAVKERKMIATTFLIWICSKLPHDSGKLKTTF